MIKRNVNATEFATKENAINVVKEMRKYQYNEICVFERGYALNVGTDDEGFKILEIWKIKEGERNFVNHEVIRAMKMGKRCTNLEDRVEFFLGLIVEDYLADRKKEVEEQENGYDVIENLVEGFNEKIENIIDGIYNETCESAVYDAKIFNDTESEYVFATMDWDIDILSIWLDHVEQWVGDEYLDVAERYYNDWENRRIYDEDGICEYVGNAYGDYIEDNCCGSCLVWVKNPYYVAEDSPKNDAPCLDEIIENALESAMDDGNEYYDDKICQVGELYVSYTSPCDEFPKGCVCVVDEEGRMYGNWCNVSDSGFAVDFLVKTLEKYNKEFNRVA